jgi:hypothetical protein
MQLLALAVRRARDVELLERSLEAVLVVQWAVLLRQSLLAPHSLRSEFQTAHHALLGVFGLDAKLRHTHRQFVHTETRVHTKQSFTQQASIGSAMTRAFKAVTHLRSSIPSYAVLIDTYVFRDFGFCLCYRFSQQQVEDCSASTLSQNRGATE